MAALALGAPSLFPACRSSPPPAELAAEARRLGAGLDCTDTRGLQQAEILTRSTNGYVETSPEPPRYCFTCDNYQPPERPATCATCRTVRGPINPAGWCKSWVLARR